WLLGLADREPRVLFVVCMLFCCFEVFFIVLFAALAERLFETLAWWTILVANGIAAAVMLGYFFRGHRVTWHQFLTERRYPPRPEGDHRRPPACPAGSVTSDGPRDAARSTGGPSARPIEAASRGANAPSRAHARGRPGPVSGSRLVTSCPIHQ